MGLNVATATEATAEEPAEVGPRFVISAVPPADRIRVRKGSGSG